jgi:hypothetical protein
MRKGLAVAAAMILVTAEASAQVCSGGLGRDAGAFQLGGSYSSTKGSSTLLGSATGIGERAFGSAGVGTISYDDFAGSTTALGGVVGYQVPVGNGGRAQLCPTAELTLGFGPKDIEGSGVDASSNSLGLGLSVGYAVQSSSQVSVIPFASAGFARTSFKLSYEGESESVSDSFGVIGFGVGLVINKQFVIRPNVSIPVGLEDSDPIVGIGVVLALGQKK